MVGENRGGIMGKFCPLLKEDCKENKCVFWLDKCLIVSFLQGPALRPDEEVYSSDDESEEEIKVPDEIKNCSADQLAEIIFSYAQKEIQSEELRWLDPEFFSEFWESKSVEDKFNLPDSIRSKIDRAERIVQKKWEKEIVNRERDRFQKEKESLPKLIEECVQWVKQNGFKKVTQSDISTFLLEKNIDILKETKTMLYSKVNLLLKE
ncbi:MAG: hypothetical protein WC549_07505 [Actinomycetota bacterium]